MDLKFLKRAWHKKTCKVYELNIIYNNNIEIIIFKNKKLLKLIYFGDNRSELLKYKPSDKIKIWFKVESRQYKKKWYTDAYLMHFEPPEVKQEPKSINNNKVLFNNQGEEFI